MYRRALQGCEKELGEDHALTLGVLKLLVCLYLEERRPREAKTSLLRASIRYSNNPPQDVYASRPYDTLVHLGHASYDLGDYGAAERYYTDAHKRYQKIYRPQHAETLKVGEVIRLFHEGHQGKLGRQDSNNSAMSRLWRRLAK